MKPLLPNNKSIIDGATNTHLLEEGEPTTAKLISNPRTVVNDFFVNTKIQESALNSKEEHFDNNPSIITIKGKSYQMTLLLRKPLQKL